MSERRVNSGTAEQKRLPEVVSSIARQLALPPVLGLTIGVKFANLMAVQRLHDPDPRQRPFVATRITVRL
jgi:hypothetical protein